MKSLLLMLLVSICVIGYRSPDLMQVIGLAGAMQRPAATSPQQAALVQRSPAVAQPKPMSVDDFARLSKTDPQAYQKFLNSRRIQEERTEADKLLNFFAHGKFE